MEIEIKEYTKERIDDVLEFERRIRTEENWGWEINGEYIASVRKSFEDTAFADSVSLLAYVENHVVGRIDSALIASHFDGSKKAYLDWICVMKEYRHKGVAQKLLTQLRLILKKRKITVLIALTAENDEAQRFYRNVPESIMRDTGIWIDI